MTSNLFSSVDSSGACGVSIEVVIFSSRLICADHTIVWTACNSSPCSLPV